MSLLTSVAAARSASPQLASAQVRDQLVRAFAARLRENAEQILSENQRDVADGRARDLSAALLDRLELTTARLNSMADAVIEVADLPDPLGETVEHTTLDNGLDLRLVRVPFGVVGVVFEARPNVASDAAALALRAGNAVVLRGSSSAVRTNAAILACLYEALDENGLPRELVINVDPADRAGFEELIGTSGSIDLIIPRGGEALKKYLEEHARVPVLAAAGGNCHIYVDASADVAMAEAIVLNAKTQRPGVCNAAETLLIHRDVADEVLPRLRGALEGAGVRVEEGEQAWETEYLDLVIATRVVDSLEQAIEHINTYGTRHSEAIVTADEQAANRFVSGVDAACVYVNASTRFTDGGVFGKGAEIGISTSKLHARGPIGLRELTTTKYVIHGTGQVRT